MVKASIIILNWNTSGDTIECIESIEASGGGGYEIILVDNASKESDFKKIKSFSNRRAKIRLFRLEKNLGFTGGCNFGAGKARGEFLIFLNNDTIVEKGFVEGLLRPFSDRSVGATCPKIYFYDRGKTDRLYHSGENYISLRGMTVDSAMGQPDRGGYDKTKEELMFSGTCFAMPRTLFLDLGGLCEFYFIYFEEADLSWRLRCTGREIIYSPSSVVYHKCSVSITVNRAQTMEKVLSARNKYLTFYRNLGLGRFAAILPLILSYDVVKNMKMAPETRFRSIFNFTIGFVKFLISTDKVEKPKKGKLSDLRW